MPVNLLGGRYVFKAREAKTVERLRFCAKLQNPTPSEVPESPSEEVTIVCPITRWYFRRLGLMAALFAGLGLFFLYDGAIGYPKHNFHADLFDAFDAGRNGVDLEAWFRENPDSGSEKTYHEDIKAAHASGLAGKSWAAFAAGKHLAEAKPERHSQAAIQQQFIFAWVLAALFAGTALVALFQRKRCLKAGADWIETAAGRRIRFSDIESVDFSKWDRGIAMLEVASGEDRNTRIRIDDYKFSGTGRILNRIRQARPEIEEDNWPELDPVEADR